MLLEVIARPLPEPLRTTVGGVISGRLKVAAAMSVPGSAVGAAVENRQQKFTTSGVTRVSGRPILQGSGCDLSVL